MKEFFLYLLLVQLICDLYARLHIYGYLFSILFLPCFFLNLIESLWTWHLHAVYKLTFSTSSGNVDPFISFITSADDSAEEDNSGKIQAKQKQEKWELVSKYREKRII